MESPVLYEVREGIAIITLNRPERLNAMTPQLFTELSARLDEAKADRQVRAVIITGAGRGFSAGGDIVGHPTFQESGPAGRDPHIAQAHDVVRRVVQHSKPVIAAVNGVAAGAGADLTWACDFRIAAEEARFVEAFINIGLMPDFGGTYFLPRLVGVARAKRMIMLGESIPAAKALEWGLVDQVVPQAQVMTAALELARQLAEKSPLALSLIREGVQSSLDKDLESALAFERYGQNLLLSTEELLEKAAAFREKSHNKA